MKKTILIFGQGGREHALAYRLAKTQNPESQIFVCPGNAGIAQEFECVSLPDTTVEGYVAIARKLNPILIVIGPEEPLALGVVDALIATGFSVFGPSKACARLESSKSFMKEICQKAKVKTAASQTLTSLGEVDVFFRDKAGRFVVKADGLCAGKGVSVCDNILHAKETAKKFLGVNQDPLFGKASKAIVVEEFLAGVEMSVISICDGEDALLFPPVRDHKRLLNNDEGPNTGGMGVVGPVLYEEAEKEFLTRVKKEIFLPVLHEMKRQGTPYKGFLYAGLMVQNKDINLLEFNVRFGDPEAQALLFGVDIDLLKICKAIASGEKLRDLGIESLKLMPTAVVVLASEGYPEAPKIGEKIEGLENLPAPKAKIFFAGVKKEESGLLVNSSGRVLACAASGKNLNEALENCYETLKTITFKGAQYRTDVGWSLL